MTMRHRTIVVLLLLSSVALAQSAKPPAPSRTVLNSAWEFLVDSNGSYHADGLPAAGWRPVQVPLSVQAQFDDLRDFKGTGWYRRSIDISRLAKNEHLLLRFGAVDYLAEVFVNGSAVGRHEGGYTPFAVDVTSAVKPGTNTLLVRVTDPPPGEDYKQIPHGKQTWYVQTTGIWQDVWLERRPAYYVETAHALTAGSTLRGFRVRLAHPELIPQGATATIEVSAPAGKPTRHEVSLKAEAEQTLEFPLQHARLWSPDDPALYSFAISLPDGDRTSGRFGFRTIEAREGRLFLNGKPYYMIGALDQDFYPHGVYSPPSKDYIVSEMRLARQLGLNTLRTHIKVPDPRYLEAADETGILIWYEIPNWDDLTDKSKRRARQTLDEMIARDWNHPSIIIQTIINESWGIDLSKADQRAWLFVTAEYARRSLPNRLVVDNSPCCGNFHLLSDLADYHNYNSIPDSAAAWDKWIAEFSSRPPWLWSKHGDALLSGQEPLIVSEFGNWGLPQLPQELPWWFERGMGESKGDVTSPAGVFQRFHEYGLDRVFRSYPELASATQRHEWEQLRHEIESMRLQNSIQGYVITEFTDVNWEGNGLITMWRAPKGFAREIGAVQRPVVVIATADKPNYRPNERASIAVAVSNYSAGPLRGLVLSVGSWKVSIPEVKAGSVVSAGTIEVPILPVNDHSPSRSVFQKVAIELHDAAGSLLNHRALDLAVFNDIPHAGLEVQISAGATGSGWNSITQRLAANHYNVGGAGVLLTPQWDATAQRLANEGGSVIVLAAGEDAFTAAGVKTVSRKGDLGGDWISNFNWFDRSRPPFQGVAIQDIAGWETREVVPRYLLNGVKPEQYGDVLSGFFLGWIRQPHAIVLQAKHGRGRVIICMWSLAASYGEDASATALLDAMVKYITSADFSAKMEI